MPARQREVKAPWIDILLRPKMTAQAAPTAFVELALNWSANVCHMDLWRSPGEPSSPSYLLVRRIWTTSRRWSTTSWRGIRRKPIPARGRSYARRISALRL